MNDFPRWKHALVVLVTVFGLLYAMPTLYPKQPAVQISANRGGDIDDTLRARVQHMLQEKDLAAESVEVKDNRVLAMFANTDVQLAASGLLREELGEQYTVALNLASTVPGWLRAIGANSMPLGLDLQGGVHFLMQVDQKSVIDSQEIRYVDDIRGLLRDRKLRYESVQRSPQGILVQLRTSEERDLAASAIIRESPDLLVNNGPSAGDSYSLIIKVKPERLTQIADNTIKQNVGTLRNRINALGVAEPMIVQQGNSRIVVELPGVQDTAEAKKILGATATLQYRAVDESVNAAEALRTGNVPPDSRIYYEQKTGRPVVLKKKVIVTGDELVDATSQPDQQTGEPAVSIVLNEAGARKMLDFTTQNVGKGMAVVYIERTPEVKIVNGEEVRTAKITEEVVSVATIRGVFSKRFQTTGLENMQVAAETALLLRAGSLAAPVDIVEERVIGATLGQDNIRQGVNAVIIGMLLVVLLVGVYYKVFGIIANLALIMNLVLLVAILGIFQATLTLPGIAGIVLTLGMAIDANVLICERIREELRNGSTPITSIRAGYEKAWATILDANVTHLVACAGLMAFGSGPIRGFAITLTIGIATSMFTSVTGTHSLVALLFGRTKRKTLPI